MPKEETIKEPTEDKLLKMMKWSEVETLKNLSEKVNENEKVYIIDPFSGIPLMVTRVEFK